MRRSTFKTSIIGLAMGLVMMALLVFNGVGTAFADSCVLTTTNGCTFTVTGGTLSFTPGTLTSTLTNSGTLDGTDQSASITIPVDVKDDSGSGAGWHIQLAMKTVTTGTYSLPATVGIALIGGCDVGSTCSLPNGDTTTSPTTETITPGAATLTTGSSPSAVTLISSPTNKGMGNMTLTTTLTESLQAKTTYAGTYSTTITMTTNTGP
jgi:hypothetical protein